MNTSPALPAARSWFSRAEGWLDSKGRGAWIAAMVLGFIFIWPVGLAILAYMIWSERMWSNRSFKTNTSSRGCGWKQAGRNLAPTGNSAFDAYKSETLRRLEEEQEAFEAFLQRLREAKDKSEFDAFMDDRAKSARAPETAPGEGSGAY
jgi:hypothetical protein